MIHRLATLALLTLSFALVGCSSKEDELAAQVKQAGQIVEQRLTGLKQHLRAGRLSNAKLIKQYAQYIKTHSPDLTDIASTLETEATSGGALYQGLMMRYLDVVEQGKTVLQMTEADRVNLGKEFQSINVAASPNQFNGALADPLNVLADMSGGKLARVGVGSTEDTQSSNGATNYGRGSTLVGNPNYGHWQQHSNGTSFWAFYGQYRLFSDLLFRPVYYNDWSRNRDYSYYHDRGRSYYSSPSQNRTTQATQSRAESRFAARGERFTGPYSKQRGTGKTYSKTRPPQNAVRRVTKTPSRFQSSYGSSTTSSSRLSSSAYSSNRPQTTTQSTRSTSYSSRGSYRSSRSFGGGGK